MSSLRNIAVAIACLAACVTYTLARSHVAPGITGYGLGLSVDPLQSLEAMASYKSVCIEEYHAAFTPSQRELLDRSRLRSHNFELARMRQIDELADEATARANLDEYLTKAHAQARASIKQAGCASQQIRDFVHNQALQLLDPKASEHVTRVIETGMPYNKPRPISAKAGAPVSFASPDLVFVLTSTLRTSSKCGSIDISAVTLESTLIAPAANKPPYIRNPQNISEIWTSMCDGVVQKHRLTFRQDDRKTWQYEIKAVN